MKTQKELIRCKENVARNIVNVIYDKPLDIPLKKLNQSCKFKKVWDEFAGKDREEKYKNKVYRNKPEVKIRLKKYFQKYSQIPEVKEKRREYHKVYFRRPDIKIKIKEYMRKYNNKPEVKLYRKKYYKSYYQKRKLEEKI